MTKTALPLSGVRVLDLSRVLAGPYCTLMLADMGAEVIKIENPDGGDDSRTFTEPNLQGHSTYFLTVNHKKRSVALDLKAPEAKAAFLRMVAHADVVVENYRTGVMERLGLGYETLRKIRPQLIYCAISGYGRSGPNVDVPGYDPIAQAEGGLMSMIGEPDREPMRVGPSLVDVVTGLYSAQAISAALRHAALTGEGRLIETTLHETALNMLANFAGANLIAGRSPTRTGNTNQVAQPAGVYKASDGDFVLAVVNDGQFRRMCAEAIGRPELLSDPRFVNNGARLRNATELQAILGACFATRTRAEWVERLRKVSVPSGMVATVAEAMSSDLVAARGAITEVMHTAAGPYRVLRTPARLHDTEAPPPLGAPLLGEHTREVLSSLAGLSDHDIVTMEAKGIAKSTTT